MEPVTIMFSRFSAFYSPLISCMSGGFLQEEGLEGRHEVATAQRSARAALEDGSCEVAQSAVSSSWAPLDNGQASEVVHFAQINLLDGFFLVAREPDPDFSWSKLAGRKVIVDHGGQPLAMFKYACHRKGLDYASIEAVDAGDGEAMEAMYRGGEGDYVHFQGPTPQQIEADGAGHIVASVGAAIGPVAFSSLAALRGWLDTDKGHAFMRAYRKARQYVIETPAAEIAAAEKPYFPNIDESVLAATIEAYQALGNWDPQVEIPRDAYETALDVFAHSGLIAGRHDYDTVCVAPPA